MSVKQTLSTYLFFPSVKKYIGSTTELKNTVIKIKL